MPAARPDAERLAVWRSFLVAHARVTELLDAELRERHDLPLAWYDVLVQLSEAGGDLTMSTLADRVLLSRSNCTRLVDRMQRDGLVERRPDPDDHRRVHAVLTADGRAVLRRAARTHLAGIDRWFTSALDEGAGTAIGPALDEISRRASDG